MMLSENIFTEALPLSELLHNSLYYPCCGFDGGVIKDCNTLRQHLNITSFIYCDYGIVESDFLKRQNTFDGYTSIGSRNLSLSELTPKNWVPAIPPGVESDSYLRYVPEDLKTYAVWTVYKRLPNRSSKYGPDFFSLIYICGEAAATYQALYWSNNQKPRALAIIQPGTAFGGNWANFTEEEGAFGWVVKNNPAGLPDFVYNGGYGFGHPTEFWKDYELIDTIQHYYSNHNLSMQGLVNLFKLEG